MTAARCQLHLFFAREADVAVIFRRGPSKWVQLIRWDTRHDTFEEGAWFHGRIYEEACDLSPDGQLFVYFAAKHNRRVDDDYGYAWTAVSRPPWLKALALWSSLDGTCPGGGRFSGNRRLTLLTSGSAPVPHPQHVPPRGFVVDHETWSARRESPEEVRDLHQLRSDHGDQVLFVRDGKVFRRKRSTDRELIDLNDRIPDPQPAPDWARYWPGKGG